LYNLICEIPRKVGRCYKCYNLVLRTKKNIETVNNFNHQIPNITTMKISKKPPFSKWRTTQHCVHQNHKTLTYRDRGRSGIKELYGGVRRSIGGPGRIVLLLTFAPHFQKPGPFCCLAICYLPVTFFIYSTLFILKAWVHLSAPTFYYLHPSFQLICSTTSYFLKKIYDNNIINTKYNFDNTPWF